MSSEPLMVSKLTPPTNLTGELVRRLSAEIESGKLAPGARLPTEHEMMSAAGVSRTVVREAISALRAQGLVVTRQGAGAFVAAGAQRRPFTLEAAAVDSLVDVLQVMELRISVEVEAAGLAAVRRTPAQLAEIGRRLKAIDQAIERGESAVDADFAFHQAICAATDNPYFLRFLDFLGHYIIPRQSVRAGFASPAELRAYLERIQAEHVAIQDAIRARQPEQARDAARLHLVGSSARYREMIDTLEQSGPKAATSMKEPSR